MSSWGHELGCWHRAEGIGKGELEPESYDPGEQVRGWRLGGAVGSRSVALAVTVSKSPAVWEEG